MNNTENNFYEVIIYTFPFNQIQQQDIPEDTICVCLIDSIDGEYETYEIIQTIGIKAKKLGKAYGIDSANMLAENILKQQS